MCHTSVPQIYHFVARFELYVKLRSLWVGIAEKEIRPLEVIRKLVYKLIYNSMQDFGAKHTDGLIIYVFETFVVYFPTCRQYAKFIRFTYVCQNLLCFHRDNYYDNASVL